MSAKGKDEPQEFNPNAGKEKDISDRSRREKRQGSEANDPSGREHQKRKDFHVGARKIMPLRAAKVQH